MPGREGLTRASILETIRTLQPQSDDAILFYYLGHGYFEPTKMVTCLRLSDDPMAELSWRDLSEEIAKQQIRLGVVILDCCNREDAPPSKMVVRLPYRQFPKQVTPVCQSLFFASRGEVVLISSSPGEYALVKARKSPDPSPSVPVGALFTNALVDTLQKSSQRPLKWRNFTATVQEQTDVYFNGLTGGEGVFSLGGKDYQQKRQTSRLVINNQLVQP
jgi:hypothetical protein